MKKLTLWCFFAGWLALFCATACSSSRETGSDARQWALGATHRSYRWPKTVAQIVTLPIGKPLAQGTRMSTHCFDATSILPQTSQERIFLIIDGTLHVISQGDLSPTKIKGMPGGMRLTRLLGSRQVNGDRVEILTSVLADRAEEESLWSMVVKDIVIEDATERTHRGGCDASVPAELATKQSFFATFKVPRCQAEGRRCLVVNEDRGGTHLDLEPSRGDARQPLQDFPETVLRDAAWLNEEGTEVLVLAECPLLQQE